MNYLEEHLRSCLTDSEKIVILGAGSVLKGDDAAGMLVIEKLEHSLDNLPQVLLVAGSTAPENFTGVIKGFQPGHIFIVDAAHLEEEPGKYRRGRGGIDRRAIFQYPYATLFDHGQLLKTGDRLYHLCYRHPAPLY